MVCWYSVFSDREHPALALSSQQLILQPDATKFTEGEDTVERFHLVAEAAWTGGGRCPALVRWTRTRSGRARVLRVIRF